MPPRTRAQAQARTQPVTPQSQLSLPRVVEDRSIGVLTTTPDDSGSSMYVTEADIEELRERAKDRHPSGLDWDGKITSIYKTLRDIEFMLHVYTGDHDEPKIEALMDMLDTIVGCLVGGGNVHSFMDDPAWRKAHSSVSTALLSIDGELLTASRRFEGSDHRRNAPMTSLSPGANDLRYDTARELTENNATSSACRRENNSAKAWSKKHMAALYDSMR